MIIITFPENLPDGSVTVFKVLRDSCSTWQECVRFSRQKFEKYFSHKALRLLHHFPPETTTSTGRFWAHPKKIPNPEIVFSASDPVHLEFVRTLACCWAHLWKIPVTLFQWKPLNVIT
jgi:ubiquitin-activating enzyme E1